MSREIDVWPASAWSNGPGDDYPDHRHSYDKILLAIAGSITFRLPEVGATFELHAGDRLDLPAGTLHGADVGPSGVSCLEAQLPRGGLHEVCLHGAWLDAHRVASETVARQGA